MLGGKQFQGLDAIGPVLCAHQTHPDGSEEKAFLEDFDRQAGLYGDQELILDILSFRAQS